MAEANGKTIVVAVDGSAPGWEAMETALSLASLLNRPVPCWRDPILAAGVPAGLSHSVSSW